VAKVDPKGNGQPNKESMVMELTIDFLLQFTNDRKFNGRKEMKQWVCGEVMIYI
jgi:hypothetical protein